MYLLCFTLFPYTTLFRSLLAKHNISIQASRQEGYFIAEEDKELGIALEKKIFSHENDLPNIPNTPSERKDRKSTRLNSSHVANSYAVFFLKKKYDKTSTFNVFSISFFLQLECIFSVLLSFPTRRSSDLY